MSNIQRLDVGGGSGAGGYGDGGATIDENGNLQSAGKLQADKGAVFFGGSEDKTNPVKIVIPESFLTGEQQVLQVFVGAQLVASINRSGTIMSKTGDIESGQSYGVIDNANISSGFARFSEAVKLISGTTAFSNSDEAMTENMYSNDFVDSKIHSTKLHQRKTKADGIEEIWGYEWLIPDPSGLPTLNENKPFAKLSINENDMKMTMKSVNGAVEIYSNADDGAVVKSTSPDDTKSIMLQATNDGAALVGIDGMMFTNAFPTTDPLDAGIVWCDAANGYVLKVSQGAE